MPDLSLPVANRLHSDSREAFLALVLTSEDLRAVLPSIPPDIKTANAT